MMSTKSTLPMLAVSVMVLLLDTPRSAAQVDSYNATQNTPPGPPPPLSMHEPSNSTVQQEPQVWNASRYPATDFRREDTPRMFALWPENLSYVKFEYYCEDTNYTRSLQDFVYKEGEGNLVTRPYFDVGVVDRDFTPYFQHWQFWKVDIKRVTWVVHCEYSDLQHLYAYRLKRKVLARALVCGVAAWGIMEGAVIIAFTALPALLHQLRSPSASKPTFWKKICHSFHTWKSETPWSECISDWIHLLLLVVIGFAMMEGIGHSDYFQWRSMLLYNVAVTYTYLTFFSMIFSFLHQCACFVTRITNLALPKNTTADTAKTKSGLSEDWRYQRIFGQFGVLVLMRMYLIGVDDDEGQGMDSLAGIVVAAVVVACIWSAGVSGVVAVRSVRIIFKCQNWKKRLCASTVPLARPVSQVSRCKTM